MKRLISICNCIIIVSFSFASHSSSTFEPQTIADLANVGNAAGVAWLDYDRDNDLDIYITNTAGPNLLYNNNSNNFELISPVLVPPLTQVESKGVVIADFDGDAQDDIFIANNGKNTLLRNKGKNAGTHLGFEDVTDIWGLGSETYPSHAACTADIDKDGDLDLMVVNWEAGSTPGDGPGAVLYRNQKNNNVTNFIIDDVGITHDVMSVFSCTFTDYNDDGNIDLFLVVDEATFQDPSSGPFSFYRNQSDGTFVRNQLAPTLEFVNSMGIAIGDINRDGRLDAYVTELIVGPLNLTNKANQLLLNLGNDSTGNTTFLRSDFLNATGVLDGTQKAYWGATFADFDNDGDVDIYTVSDLPTSCTDCRHVLYTNRLDEGLVFEETIIDDRGVGLAAGDYNRDGLVDLLVMDAGGKVQVLRNTTISTGDNWIRLELLDSLPNTRAIGAKVKLRATINGAERLLVREVVAGSSHSSTEDPILHFGLGNATSTNVIEIRWPDGCMQTVQGLSAGAQYQIPRICGN